MKMKNDKYHNLCRKKSNNTKLERPQKRHRSPSSGSSSKGKSPKLNVFTSNLRSKEKQPDPVEHLYQCFICDKELHLSA